MIEGQIDVTSAEYSSGVWKGPFDKAREAMLSKGYSDIPLWLNALLREQQGYGSSISQNENWVRNGVLYWKGENMRLLPEGLCLLDPQAATHANRNSEEYTLEGISSGAIEQARGQGLEIKAKDLGGHKNLVIPTNRFGSDIYAIHLFGGEGTDKEKSKRAQNHGEWLINSPREITELTLYLTGKSYIDEGEPFATQLFLDSISDISSLLGHGRFLDEDETIRGARLLST